MKRTAILLQVVVAATWNLVASQPFTWGVCGHPSLQGPYSDLETQFLILNRRGLSTYRFDVQLIYDDATVISKLEPLVDLARKHKIILHPVLHVPFDSNDATDHGRYPNSQAGLEAQGHNRVYPIVGRFAHEIRDWELENELTLRKGFKMSTGEEQADYETPLAEHWSAVLRGMSRAIAEVRTKSGEPLRALVDLVYVDFGYVPFLESRGVFLEKLAYHYYYTYGTDPRKLAVPPRQFRSQEIRTQNGSRDLFGELAKFGKPVIINELNAAEIYDPLKNIPYDDSKAVKSLKKHIESILSQNQVRIEGVELYELFDEPGKNAAESNFGLMADATRSKVQMLLVSAFACGELPLEERATLISHGVFTLAELADDRSKCNSLR